METRRKLFGHFNHFLTKLAKCKISVQLFVRMFVWGLYTYFETTQVFFSFVSEKRGGGGSKLRKFMTDIQYKILLKIFCIFFAS